MYFDDFEVMLTEGKVVQSNNYYPFGLQQNTSWTRMDQTPNAHKFNAATEYNDFTDTYDTPFRQYDPATGRFNGVDALAHMTPTLTPYRFGFNNPVSFNDPTGLKEKPVELLMLQRKGGSVLSGADNVFSMSWLSGSMGRSSVGSWADQAWGRAGAAGMNRNAVMMPGYAFNQAYGVTDETRFDVARRYSSDGADALSSVGLSIVTNQSYDPDMPGSMMPVHGLMYEGTFLGNLGPDYFSDNMGPISGTTGSFGDVLRGWADGIRNYVMGNTQGLRDKTQEWSDGLDEHGKLVTALSHAAHERLAPAKGIMEMGFAGSGIASGIRLSAAKAGTTVFQEHHIIPNQVYKTFKSDLKAIGWKQNDIWNLKKLPTPFHGNHPAYNNYIMNEMNLLRQSGNLNLNSMQNLQHNMRLMIGDAYRSGRTLNQYFKF